MARRSFLLISIACFVQLIAAQSFTFAPNKFGANLFAGGMDTPRFQFVDIDGDGDADLFVLDRDERLMFFRNLHGTLVVEPKSTFGLPAGSWFRFADIDSDGDQDCLTNSTSSEVSLYTNTGNAFQPKFTMTDPELRDTSGIALFSERFSIPTLADPDGDGDLDFFTGGSIGSITYYRNIGTKFAPQFTYITSEYQGINIQGGPAGFPKALHGASGIEFFDADSNGVLDLFWGDYFNPSLYFLKNTGTASLPSIMLTDSTYPKEAVIKTFGFNFPQHIDIDANGTVDLMVGCVFPNAEKDNFMFYSNVGTNTHPFYQLNTKNFLPMIDAGSRSTVAAADLDRDGDLDLCIASAGGTVNIYRNDGTKISPVFSAEPTSSMLLPGEFNLSVTAGHMTNDSLPDLLIGTFEHGLKVFQNTASDGVISFVQQSHPLEGFLLGQNTSPAIADLNGDGKDDVLVGNSGGQITVLKNTTNQGNLSYHLEQNFNNIDVGNDAHPLCMDIDDDGLLDLIVGNINGVLHHYEQKSVNAWSFSLHDQSFADIDVRLHAAPEAADLDGDGDADLVIGNGKGGVCFFEHISASSGITRSVQVPADFIIEQNYPNPFNPSTTISFSLPFAATVKISIFDLLGRELEVLMDSPVVPGKYSLVWNAVRYPTGTYLYRCSVTGATASINTVHSMLLIK